jgi:Mg2+/Co2+ transporter CorB
MDPQSWLILGVILVLLVFSALFSGTETAFTAASRAYVNRKAQDGDRRAQQLARLRENKDKVVAAILVGNNFVNTTATALASALLIALFGEGGVIYASLAMTVLLVIFSEVLPKTYALQHAEQSALRATPLLTVVMRVLGPLASGVNLLVRSTMGVFGVKAPVRESDVLSEDELLGVIDMIGAGSQGEAERAAREERRMLRGVLALDDMTLDEVMTHRSRIEALDADDPAEDIIAALLSARHSRLPLWRDDGADVIGILDAATVLRAMQERKRAPDIEDLISMAKPVTFVPDTRLLRNQLEEFRVAETHLALVVDEYGEIEGLVTLEDILEVIVGPVTRREAQVVGLKPDMSSVEVRGDHRIRDLNRALDWRLPETEAVTVGGLVVAAHGGVPPVGFDVRIGEYTGRVVARRGLRIDRLALTRAPREA